jgi:hypothetical protein
MATAIIQVAYEAETTSLKNTVNEINQINDKVVQGATDSAKKVKTQFDAIGKSFEAAFSSGQVKKSLDNQTKAIDGLTNSGKSLTGQLRGLKAELANLELAGQDGTQAFNELLIAAAKLEDQIGDTRAKVKILASDTFKFDAAVGATQALASGFELAQGAAALFGSENEDLQKAIVKITAATAVANGVQQLANLVRDESAIKTAVLTGATVAYNLVVGTSTGLMKAFRLALAGTGIGLLVVGLIALVENFEAVKDAINGTNDTSRALAETLEATKNALGGAVEETNKVGTAFELAREGVISKEAALIIYNDTLGASLGKTNDFNKAEQNFINKKGAYIEATAARAKAQALLAQAAILSAEAATAGEEDVRNVGEKILAFSVRASSEYVKLQTAGIVNFTDNAKAFNNQIAENAQERVIKEKSTQAQIRSDLSKSEFEKAAIIEKSAGILSEEEQKILDDAQAKKDAANEKAAAKQKAAADKAIDAAKKAAEDQKKAREQLDKDAEDAFIASLDAQSKILNESNNKIIELEKTFAAARFKAGSEEEIKALEQQAIVIASIRAKATADVAALEKTANEKLFKDKLDAAKAAEGATLQQQLAALEEQKTIELSFADKLGLSELEIATRYATAIGKVKTDIAAAAIETQINELKTLEIEEGSSLERRVALINIEADKRRQTAKDTIKDQKQLASELELINAETQQSITTETKSETDKRIDLAVQYADQVVNVFNALNELSKVNSENRIAEITATSEAELNAINSSTDLERDKQKQRVALEKRTQQGIANEKTKQARRDKALALFNIAVDTATSIIKTGAQLGYPAAIPFQVAAGIIGAIQLAAVAAKPLPKFAQGGLIGGKLHSQGGTMIEAEQGEYMVNRRQTSKHRRELDAMNTSTEAFRRMIDERYVRPALMGYSAGRRGKEGVTVNASLNSKSMEKELKTINKTLKGRNVVVNINQQDSRYSWQ